jgi:DNA-binding MarR family transcriptional regulator
MASIEQEIKQSSFQSAQVKANVNVLFTANWLSNKIGAVLKNHNLTGEQFNVLRILRGRHPENMCQKDILRRMIARQSNLTLIIKKLQDKNFISVQRSEVDRREYVIAITNTGLEVLADIDKLDLKKMDAINKLTDEDAGLLSDLLDKMRGEEG